MQKWFPQAGKKFGDRSLCWNPRKWATRRPFIPFQGIENRVSRPLVVIETFQMVQNVRKNHNYIGVMKQHIL